MARLTKAALASLIAASFAGVWLPPVLTISGVNLRAHQVVLGLIGIGSLVFWRPRWRFVMVPDVWAAVLLSVAFALQTALFSRPLAPALAQAALLVLNVLTYAVAYALLSKDPERLDWALKCAAACTSAAAAWTVALAVGVRNGWSGIDQFTFLEQLAVVNGGEVTAELVPRLWNATIGGSLFAAWAVTAFILAVSKRSGRKLWLLSAGAALVGVATSAARGPLVAVGVGAVVYMALSIRDPRRFARFVLISLVGVMTLRFLLNQDPRTAAIVGMLEGKVASLVASGDYQTGTAAGRLEAWAGMWNDIKSNPFVGRGALAYRQYFSAEQPTSENFPLEVVHSAGLAGAIALVGCFGGAIFRGWRWSWRGRRVHRQTVGALLAGFCGLLVASATNPVAWSGLFWVLLALLACATRIAQAQAHVPIPHPIKYEHRAAHAH